MGLLKYPDIKIHKISGALESFGGQGKLLILGKHFRRNSKWIHFPADVLEKEIKFIYTVAAGWQNNSKTYVSGSK